LDFSEKGALVENLKSAGLKQPLVLALCEVHVHEKCLLASLGSIFVATAKLSNEKLHFLQFSPGIHRMTTKDNYKRTEILKNYEPGFTEIGI
jgi:hypothetical protein